MPKPSTFRYRKSKWKSRVRAEVSKATAVFEDVHYSRRPNLYDVLAMMEEMQLLGDLGEDLHKEAVDSQASEAVKSSIVQQLRFIEKTSVGLFEVCTRLGMPVEDMPVYRNRLTYKAKEPTPSYQDVLEGIE
jgi:hypothetical protein